jgi:peptide/nickel transport system permease protein
VKGYILRRLALIVPTMFLVTLLSFVLLQLSPGDPVEIYAGFENHDPEYIARVRAELGFDQPLPVQYVAWLGHVVRGDLGTSFVKRRPVADVIAEALPRTAELGILALLIHATVGMAVGMISALKRDSVIDLLSTSAALVLISIPGFVIAFMLIIVFTITVRIFPPGGYVPLSEDPLAHVRALILPALAIGSGSLAGIMRQTRSSLLEVLDEDYIRTSRAKGLRERLVVFRHALRNALIPVATIVGLQIGAVIEGAFIIETIFAWPGVGRLTVDAINQKDYAVVQGTVLIAALSFLLSTLLTDLVYAWLDPRISYSDRSGG